MTIVFFLILAKLGKKHYYVKGIYFVQIKGQVISEERQ